MRRGRGGVLILVVAALVCHTEPVVAEHAETLIADGVKLRKAGDDLGALDRFRRAYELSPTSRARAQMALAEQALDRWLESEAHLREALAAKDDPWIERSRHYLEEASSVIAGHLGWLEVQTTVPRAELSINGRYVGRLPTPAATRVVAGAVHIEVRAEDWEPVEKSVHVAPGGRVVVQIDPDKRRPRQSNIQPRSSAAPVPSRTAGWITGGLGIATLSAGAFFGVRTLRSMAEQDSECDATGCSEAGLRAYHDARTSAWIATATLGAGVLATGIGLWLLIAPRSSSAPSSTLGLRVGAGSLRLEGRF